MSLDTSRLDAERSRLVMIQPEPFNAEAPPEALHGEITPVALHYVRSNFALPEHDGTLHVGGAVGRPLTFSLEDLRAMTPVTRSVTLECAGNGRLGQAPMPVGEPWGWNAVSTAQWTGVLLHELLAETLAHRQHGIVRWQWFSLVRIDGHGVHWRQLAEHRAPALA